MEITLNNDVRTIPQPCSVQQLLDDLFPGLQKGMAVAINNEVVPRDHWPAHTLRPQDDVLIIKATQGG